MSTLRRLVEMTLTMNARTPDECDEGNEILRLLSYGDGRTITSVTVHGNGTVQLTLKPTPDAQQPAP